MKIIVTGGAGFLGSRVIRALLAQGGGKDGVPAFDGIVSVDLVPCPVQDPRVSSVTGDIADPAFARSVITPDTVGVYHLAAVLSGGSEQDFDLAMRVNVDGTRALLEAARATGRAPRFVFTSSLAVFGGEMPEVVPESMALMPASTYGAQKAIGEFLVNDYSRKGFVDGRVCRLPTIVVRPGKPNSAASSFASGIIREPLAGIPANCPVPLETRMWLSSPDAAVANLVHAIAVDSAKIGQWRTLNLPGLCVTVAEMLASLERVGGAASRALVSHELEQRVMDIVCSWPGAFDVARPLALGFTRDSDFDSVVRQYKDEFVR
ncbi:D-erythronate dehydrogenase [Roseomonas marmotae]|uniref:SDR family oxidoreductase n=1 Tax=Roseomonas marmotae TaxID=2768161 RepID=A0ABS3K878_9PROT|nr:D-erythronate dehydrogenase [Roseomonas marmotae]MBO1073678.1 SDR family oxidoreductase [Roseomonas marmotae]QTI78680.1 SDR family oxidoreductase [Roseomonas marmotae]